MTTTTIVSAYKTAKKNELFLFTPKETQLDNLPNELLVMFGEPVHIFDFDLTQNKKLPRSDAKEVLEALTKKGYYIQMPPGEIEKAGNMTAPPERLDNIF